MKYTFSLIYELDAPLPVAVATYLDAEHYAFLHRKHTPCYEIIEYAECKTRILQTWLFGPYRIGQYCTCEYVPPARFLNYDIKPWPWWVPSILHVISVRTDQKYYPDSTGEKTTSDLTCEIDMPFWLWPLRHVLRRKLERLKIEKDKEDIAMIERRAKLFGRGNIRTYLADHQFLLYKDHFVRHFGQHCTP